MMAGNPNWWSINDMHPHDHHLINSSSQFHVSNDSSSFSSSNTTTTTTTATTDHHHHHHHIPTQDFPVRSWSQLLLGGLGGGEEEISRFGSSLFQQPKKLDQNWVDVKQEDHQSSSQFINNYVDDDQFHESTTPSSNCNWTTTHHHHDELNVMPLLSTPNSCSISNNFLSFKAANEGTNHHHHNQDHSSECNSTNHSGGVSKKARVQHSSPQPALKVRKEKLGDRITALHQIVSPFGKTDTASVLSEAIGYIRFLQGQIEALSFPYMRNASANTGHQHQHSVQERNCLFPEESGQFLNNMGVEGRGVPKQEYSENSRGAKDLRSRGLCLVPISCTQNVGNIHHDNGADYWAPSTFNY